MVVRVVLEGEDVGEEQVEDVRDSESSEVSVGRGGHARSSEDHYGEKVADHTNQTEDWLDVAVDVESSEVSQLRHDSHNTEPHRVIVGSQPGSQLIQPARIT